MPGSCAVLDQWYANKLQEISAAHAIEFAWDIGSGGEEADKPENPALGKRGKMLKTIFPDCHLRGSEPDERYVKPAVYDEFDRLTCEKILEQRIFCLPAMDLIIFGDVLEHLPYGVALSMINWAVYNATWVILLWPINYVQGVGADGQAWDVHASHLDLQDIVRYTILEYRSQPAGGFFYNGAVLRGIRDRTKEGKPA